MPLNQLSIQKAELLGSKDSASSKPVLDVGRYLAELCIMYKWQKFQGGEVLSIVCSLGYARRVNGDSNPQPSK